MFASAVGAANSSTLNSTSDGAGAKWFEIQIGGSDHNFKARFKEDASFAFSFQDVSGGPERRYTLRARRPLPANLPKGARSLADPVSLSLRLDSKPGPNDWLVEFEQNYLIPSGNSISVQASSTEKQVNLHLGARALTEQEAQLAKSQVRQGVAPSPLGGCWSVTCGRWKVTLCGDGCVECGGIWIYGNEP